MEKIKEDLSREIQIVILHLLKEFPDLGIPISQIAYEESGRKDTHVYFSAPVKIPAMFEDTLFKELNVCIRIKLVSRIDQYNDTGKDYYWANISWNYKHPSGGTNGHSFCDISMNLDGSTMNVRTEKERVV